MDMMAVKLVIVFLRVVQFLAAVANLAMSSMVIKWYLTSTPWAPAAIFSFLIFAPVLSILSIAFLEVAPRKAPQAISPSLSLAVEATNTIFYFAGFIALAVYISRLLYCDGTVCAVGRATSIVAAIEFVAWIASTILMAKDIFKDAAWAEADFDVEPQGLRQRRQARQAGMQPLHSNDDPPRSEMRQV